MVDKTVKGKCNSSKSRYNNNGHRDSDDDDDDDDDDAGGDDDGEDTDSDMEEVVQEKDGDTRRPDYTCHGIYDIRGDKVLFGSKFDASDVNFFERMATQFASETKVLDARGCDNDNDNGYHCDNEEEHEDDDFDTSDVSMREDDQENVCYRDAMSGRAGGLRDRHDRPVSQDRHVHEVVSGQLHCREFGRGDHVFRQILTLTKEMESTSMFAHPPYSIIKDHLGEITLMTYRAVFIVFRPTARWPLDRDNMPRDNHKDLLSKARAFTRVQDAGAAVAVLETMVAHYNEYSRRHSFWGGVHADDDHAVTMQKVEDMLRMCAVLGTEAAHIASVAMLHLKMEIVKAEAYPYISASCVSALLSVCRSLGTDLRQSFKELAAEVPLHKLSVLMTSVFQCNMVCNSMPELMHTVIQRFCDEGTFSPSNMSNYFLSALITPLIFKDGFSHHVEAAANRMKELLNFSVVPYLARAFLRCKGVRGGHCDSACDMDAAADESTVSPLSVRALHVFLKAVITVPNVCEVVRGNNSIGCLSFCVLECGDVDLVLSLVKDAMRIESLLTRNSVLVNILCPMFAFEEHHAMLPRVLEVFQDCQDSMEVPSVVEFVIRLQDIKHTITENIFLKYGDKTTSSMVGEMIGQSYNKHKTDEVVGTFLVGMISHMLRTSPLRLTCICLLCCIDSLCSLRNTSPSVVSLVRDLCSICCENMVQLRECADPRRGTLIRSDIYLRGHYRDDVTPQRKAAITLMHLTGFALNNNLQLAPLSGALLEAWRNLDAIYLFELLFALHDIAKLLLTIDFDTNTHRARVRDQGKEPGDPTNQWELSQAESIIMAYAKKTIYVADSDSQAEKKSVKLAVECAYSCTCILLSALQGNKTQLDVPHEYVLRMVKLLVETKVQAAAQTRGVLANIAGRLGDMDAVLQDKVCRCILDGRTKEELLALDWRAVRLVASHYISVLNQMPCAKPPAVLSDFSYPSSSSCAQPSAAFQNFLQGQEAEFVMDFNSIMEAELFKLQLPLVGETKQDDREMRLCCHIQRLTGKSVRLYITKVLNAEKHADTKAYRANRQQVKVLRQVLKHMSHQSAAERRRKHGRLGDVADENEDGDKLRKDHDNNVGSGGGSVPARPGCHSEGGDAVCSAAGACINVDVVGGSQSAASRECQDFTKHAASAGGDQGEREKRPRLA